MILRRILLVALASCAYCLVSDAPQATAQSQWPDPIAHDVIPYHTSGLTHGPMIGRPTDHSMRVWIRTDSPQSFRVLYDTKLPLLLESSPSVSGRTRHKTDSTGYVEITDLEPGQTYYYGVALETGLVDTRPEFDDPWPTFKTLPNETTNEDQLNNPEGWFNFSFSLACCSRQLLPDNPPGIYGNPPGFLTLLKDYGDDVDFHIVNGDFTYEEVLDGTREGYAANYQLYLKRGRNMSNFFRYVPFIGMYNDHEVNSNLDGAGEAGLGDGDYLRRDPALEVWEDYVGWSIDPAEQRGPIYFGKAKVEKNSDLLRDDEADFSALKTSQISTLHVGHYMAGDGRSKAERGGKNIGVYSVTEVVDDHTLRVEPPFKEAGDAPYSIGTHYYFDRIVSNCHFIYLDTRGERSKFKGESHANDPDRFLLGETQKKWFLETVQNSPCKMIFVISPDPWTIYHSSYHVRPDKGTGTKGDGYCGYVHEREELIEAFDKIQKPILIFTGDVHNSFSVQITDNIWEFMCGPMNSAGHPIGTAGLPPFGGWFDSAGRKVKIKWVAGFPDNVHYSRQRNIYYAVVQVNNVMKAARPEGQGYQWVPYDEPQVVVQFIDGYTGKMVYAEGVSTLDSKKEQKVAPKESRWPPQINEPAKK
ncbi:Secreted alkaline phosphatase [Planctomycetales bacterium 10988]|nr:Secreted alkaline phosphatase [Planctomycetales bacterium 10988]